MSQKVIQNGSHKIHKFVDGDTFWVKMDAGKTEKIRLIGVDTPEVRWEGLTEEQPGGKEASDYVKNLLKGKKVLLEYDVQKYDRYGRTLAYVYLVDSTFVRSRKAFTNQYLAFAEYFRAQTKQYC